MLSVCCMPAWCGPIGSPVQVFSGGAFWPAIRYNATADQHLVLWVDVADANGWQLKGRRFDPDTGSLVGSEFYVSPDPPNIKAIVGAACYNSTNGEWFVVYQGSISGGEDDVLGQRIASNGTKIGAYIPLVVKSSFQNGADVAWDPVNSQYLVIWNEKPGTYRTVKGRFFDQTGSPIGSEFQIRDAVTYDSHGPQVAYNPVAGEFMVVWQDYRNYTGSGQDNEYSDIYAQRINASTRAKIGNNIAIYWGGSPYVPNGQDIPGSIACNTTDGRYFIPIQKLTSVEDYRTYGLVINSDGSWYSSGVFDISRPEFGVPTGAGYNPGDNTYFTSYEDLTDGHPNTIRGRQFSAAGLGIGSRVDVNTVAGGTRGGVLDVRPSDGQYTQILCTDSSGAIYAQRYTNEPDTFAPANVNPLRAYRQSDSTVLLTWANAADPDVAGTMVRYRTDHYPTSITDGTLVCNRSATASSSDSFTHSAPAQTCYYTAFSYDALPNYSSGASAASSNVWLDEPFDSYAVSSLDPQGGWIRDPARNGCAVQSSTRAGASGNGVELFGTATVYDDATLANFGAITGGYHRVSFDMRRNTSAANNQAFIGIYQGSTIITRVYWSTSFSLLYGPGANFTDLVTGPVSGQWYHVELGIDLTSGTLDAWVDGVQKVFARPFYQSATQINTINLTGYSAATAASYLDNLRGERVAAAPAAPMITLPTVGADVESPLARIEWTGETHDMLEVHANTTNIATDGSAYDSGEIVSSLSVHKAGPLAAEQTYYAFVRLHNSSGWGSWSATGRWFRVVPNANPPGSPAGLTATGTNGAVSLAWTNPSDKDLAGITIRSRGDTCPMSATDGALVTSIAGATPGAAQSFVHSPLANGISRYYGVFAYDDGGLYSAPACDSAAAEPWTVTYPRTRCRPHRARSGLCSRTAGANLTRISSQEAACCTSWTTRLLGVPRSAGIATGPHPTRRVRPCSSALAATLPGSTRIRRT